MTVLSDMVQLHERIEVFYVVTGWVAQLFTSDRCVIRVEGNTVEHALDILRCTVRNLSLQDMRRMPEI